MKTGIGCQEGTTRRNVLQPAQSLPVVVPGLPDVLVVRDEALETLLPLRHSTTSRPA
jgi:hypothetical protein